ncbi:glyoxalase/bleomycin resistance/extradiol dioxygenase family protein [Evansella clarkii]|uniref:glyoxalase/bleomycin resistance/extradiol dioxygenase family protein n=1 Tax=Evansella clarkii TaxID=79879 RepID=UPI000996012F|nr:glyoxalase/bleomycin resistance/extradiol dioxygenase family protein [Evansella clarkii]
MKVLSFYPVILTNEVSQTAEFYECYFNFQVVFETDWYVSLKLQAFELGIVKSCHETIPTAIRNQNTKGLILNIEVENVNDHYNRLIRKSKLPNILPLCNEDFGQRHFITSDPNGVIIDVIQEIPPSSEFQQYFKDVQL